MAITIKIQRSPTHKQEVIRLKDFLNQRLDLVTTIINPDDVTIGDNLSKILSLWRDQNGIWGGVKLIGEVWDREELDTELPRLLGDNFKSVSMPPDGSLVVNLQHANDDLAKELGLAPIPVLEFWGLPWMTGITDYALDYFREQLDRLKKENRII